jgi:YbgC/YbaW family acyl-CoA thioester hydrolase
VTEVDPAGYRHEIHVRYGEVDMQRVVFNSHYLAYCDDAVENWLKHLGVKVADFGWDFMLKRATIEWQGSATVNDRLDIDVAIDRWGKTSFDVGFTGAVGEEPVFTCTITYVGVELGTLNPVPPPPALRARLGGPAPASG